MARLEFTDTPLAGLKLVQRKPIEDMRGYFSRFFCAAEFASAGIENKISQINHSQSKQAGTLRGVHFQLPPHAECKFISCIRGEIFDVAVDLRKGSPTFLHWYGEQLSAANQRSLLIPEGFGHGFQTLTNDCEILYLVSAAYEPGAERAINAMDTMVNIKWPLPVAEISEKDRNCPLLSSDFQGIDLGGPDQVIPYTTGAD